MQTNQSSIKLSCCDKQYVIFDLDGTLIDSFDTIVVHCKSTCDYFNVDYGAFDFEQYRYSDLHKLFAALTFDIKIDHNSFKFIFDTYYQKEPLKGTKILSKGYEYLKRSKDEGYKCIILTNKYQAIAELICNELFEDNLVDSVIGRTDSKPIKLTDGILMRLRNLGIQKDQIITYYGDSYTDERCAYALGTKYIKIDNINNV